MSITHPHYYRGINVFSGKPYMKRVVYCYNKMLEIIPPYVG